MPEPAAIRRFRRLERYLIWARIVVWVCVAAAVAVWLALAVLGR